MDDGSVAQVGTPTEVYEQPATAYVADFLGVANLIAATGEAGRGGRRQVHLGEFTLDAIGDGPAGPVKLVIRPERVRVAAGEAAGPNCLPGMVERVVYIGATTQVHVRLPGGEALQALTANHDGRPDWPAGTPVGVTLPADALRALAGLTSEPEGEQRPVGVVGVGADQREPEVVVEADRPGVGGIDTEVDAGDAAVTQGVEEGVHQAAADTPTLEPVGAGRCAGGPGTRRAPPRASTADGGSTGAAPRPECRSPDAGGSG